MSKTKIIFWLLALLFVQNWACRKDNIIVKYYHERDLEPMDTFDFKPIGNANENFTLKMPLISVFDDPNQKLNVSEMGF